MSEKKEHQLAPKRSLKLKAVGVLVICGGEQSILRPGRTYSKNRFPPGKMNVVRLFVDWEACSHPVIELRSLYFKSP